MSTETNNLQHKWGLSEGMTLALSPIVAYFLAYQYEVGYFAFFCVPIELITVDTTTLLVIGSTIVGFLIILFQFDDMLIRLTPEGLLKLPGKVCAILDRYSRHHKTTSSFSYRILVTKISFNQQQKLFLLKNHIRPGWIKAPSFAPNPSLVLVGSLRPSQTQDRLNPPLRAGIYTFVSKYSLSLLLTDGYFHRHPG